MSDRIPEPAADAAPLVFQLSATVTSMPDAPTQVMVTMKPMHPPTVALLAAFFLHLAADSYGGSYEEGIEALVEIAREYKASGDAGSSSIQIMDN